MRLRASLAIVLLSTGCTNVHRMPKSELTKLDGWRDDGKTMLEDIGGALRGEKKDIRRLIDDRGREHKFDRDTSLVLVLPGGRELTESYIQVDVNAERFLGVPTERPGRPVTLPMEQIQGAGVRKFSLSDTLLLTGGVGILLFSGLLAVGLATGGGGGGGDDD
jgi:hypothetical protein